MTRWACPECRREFGRRPAEYSGRWHHVVNLGEAEEVDDLVRGWLTEAYGLEVS